MSVTTTGLWRMSATDLAEAIRSGQASSQEVIEAHLRRIETVNPSVSAVTVILDEQALASAKAADRAVAGDSYLLPLHGVPVTIKENIDLAGTPTTQGAKAPARSSSLTFSWAGFAVAPSPCSCDLAASATITRGGGCASR